MAHHLPLLVHRARLQAPDIRVRRPHSHPRPNRQEGGEKHAERNFSLQNKPYRISSLCCQPLTSCRDESDIHLPPCPRWSTRVPRPHGEVLFAHIQDRGQQERPWFLFFVYCGVAVRASLWESVLSFGHVGSRNPTRTWQQAALPAMSFCQARARI